MKVGRPTGGGGGRRLTEQELRELEIRRAHARRIDDLVADLRATAPRRTEVHITREKTPDTVMLGVRRRVERDYPVPDARLITAELDPEELRSVLFRVTQPLPETYETHVDLPGGLSLKQVVKGDLWHTRDWCLHVIDGGQVEDLGDEWHMKAPGTYQPTLEIWGRHLAEHVLVDDGTVILVDKERQVYGRPEGPVPKEVQMANDTKTLSDTYVVRPDGTVTGYRFKQPPVWSPGNRSIEVVKVSGALEEDGTVALEDGARFTAPIAPQKFWAAPPASEGRLDELYSTPEERYTVEAAGSASSAGPQIVEEESWIMIADYALEVRI